MASKQKPFVTARGRFIYPHFHAPDTKFDENGVYRTKFALDPEKGGNALVKQIEDALKEQLAKARQEAKEAGKKFKDKMADKPYSVDDETGEIVFNFKKKASGLKKGSKTERWTASLAMFDASRTPIPANTRVGGGSEGKIAYTLNPFTTAIGTGVSLRLESVQILELKEFTRNAESFGFEDEEGFEQKPASSEDSEEAGEDAEESGAAPAKGADF